ncbi:DODA-type extradiol aromatic ring-opening family dioxygenase [Paenibacillus sp. OAS669]|uniref:DODA-type extradiol aromatic ring-opening family dioxygenase n=1 Tax=Paenibacillus sp. OAS669 TaxID=2663821 RepID=UPI00178A1BB9|nr:class III extradiol ring-cleavage dioxygenase [Paenibacillus sp. OAS669]MBE1443632.1 4,5-DOPA dioxygenase extradiol [Paenibacillus sp. OAS669]
MGTSFFIGHGSPMLAIQDLPYTRELRQLGERLGKPEAVILFSAHWVSRQQELASTDQVYETIYDFGGFPDELFRVVYPARGSVSIADELHGLFEAAGIPAARNTVRGLDHGSWVVLRHMYPEADVPVIALSVNPLLPPEQQYRIGQALAEFSDQRNVVIIGSGATVHNFRAMDFGKPEQADSWAKEFDDWLIGRMQDWDTAALFDYLKQGPYAKVATPDYEHFLPVFIAMGAGDTRKKAKLLHQNYQYGSLSHLIVQF